MACRGIRGATTTSGNKAEDVLARTQELLEEIRKRNGFRLEELASILFTATTDLNAAFPAQAARALGWKDTPMMCAHEIDVPGSLTHCIRVMILWNTEKPAGDIRLVYLHGAERLRPDLAEEFAAQNPAEAAFRTPASIAFQGEHGAYSEEAILLGLGDANTRVSCRTFAELFLAVVSGRTEAALLPVENSTTGSIHSSYDLLLENQLHIVGELILPVRHAVMVPPGVEAETVRQVISHPQALEQCSRWIASQNWEAVPVHDTAGAARMIAEDPRPDRAAIASETAARLHGLKVLARSIQDVQANYTRFLLLAKDPEPIAPPAKTSLIFATMHKPGSLHACLDEFSRRGINLTKIESRPDRKTPWHYLFYLDFEGDSADPKVVDAMEAMKSHTEFLRVLGSYPSRTLGRKEEE